MRLEVSAPTTVSFADFEREVRAAEREILVHGVLYRRLDAQDQINVINVGENLAELIGRRATRHPERASLSPLFSMPAKP